MKSKFIILFILATTMVLAQEKNQKVLEREARQHVRDGNKLYNQLKFSEAEIEFKKALDKNSSYPNASYNLGNSVYQQQRNKEAVAQYELVEKTMPDEMSKAEAYHNMGNSFMNEKQYAQAITSFKNSLRNNSKDDETRYNLALAQKLLKQQQQENKDNKGNQDNKDQQKEKEGGDEEKKKNEKKEKDQKNPPENKDKKEENKQPRPNQLSPEQMKQLLEAMNNEENKTQKKINAQKAKGKKIKQQKDW